MNASLPVSRIDLFSEELLLNPHDAYKELREQGAAVWMEHSGYVAVPRYKEVREVLVSDETFISGRGVALNDTANQYMEGTVIASDGADHKALRNVLAERLSPRALTKLAADVQAQADALIDSLWERKSFDTVTDLARRFPMMVVLELIGLPEEGRDNVLGWADNSFNLFGPMTATRTVTALESIQPVFDYAFKVTTRGVLRPGSMGDAILDAVDAGLIPAEKAGGLMVAYLTGGLDTTIASISHAVKLFGTYPEEWDKVRKDPSLIPGAYNEVLRYESPAHWFSRQAKKDTVIGDVEIKAGTRVLPLFASANRDERKWKNPDVFDVLRAPMDHVAFGYGMHGCAGQGVARLEAHSLLTALARKVERFEIGEQERSINNIIHGYKTLQTTLH